MVEYQYRFHCNDEQTDKYISLPYPRTDPIVCPIDPNHSIGPACISSCVPNGNVIMTEHPANVDAFGRKRISFLLDLFGSKQLSSDSNFFLWDIKTDKEGSSSYSQNAATTTLSVGAQQYSYAVRQSKTYQNYQPGKSQLVIMTFVFGDHITGSTDGIRKRVGCFNTLNGIFLESRNGEVCFVIRSNESGSVSNNRASQSNWNHDPLNGTGKSKITLDFTKSQICVIDFEWLGVGCVRCGFVIDGYFFLAHVFKHTNKINTVYMSSPNLPLRYEIMKTKNNDNTGSLKTICAMVASEGGAFDIGMKKAIDMGNQSLTISSIGTNLYPLVVLRLKSTHPFATIKINSIIVMTHTTNSTLYYYCAVINPTYSSNLTYTSLPNSAIEYAINTSNTVTVSGGTKLFSQYISQTNSSASSNLPNNTNFYLGSSADVTATDDSDNVVGSANSVTFDTCAICVSMFVGSNNTPFYANVVFEETF